MRYRATILDAGVGNLGNLARALAHVDTDCTITTDPEVVASARCLLLPGVGAFKPPRENLRGELEAALREALERGAWLLGICVGYQLLFAASDEFGATDGLDLLPGTIRRLRDDVPLPHIGWNRLHGGALGEADTTGNGATGDGAPRHPLLAGLTAGCHVYFVHSYAPFEVPAEAELARATHGDTFTAVAGRGRVLGTQFHPEKSGRTGLRLLANYLEIAHAAPAGD